MAKDNIRSFRFSNEIAAILEKQSGDSLNAQFENLILYCYNSLPEIDKKLRDKRRELEQLIKDCDRKRMELHEYQSLEVDKKRLSQALTNIAIMAVDYQEKLKKATKERDDGK